MNDLQMIDITEDLIILNKVTIESLFKLDNCAESIALYLLYYKLAKCQKTNTIKANDSYVQKCLKWGKNKVSKIKQVLKDNGLIEIVQRRNSGKIDGWFIKVHYLVSTKEHSKIVVEQEPSNQEPSKSTNCSQDTIALRININCLKNKIELLKEENNKLKSLLKENTKERFNQSLFEMFWEAYPKKVSKGNAEKWFAKNQPNEELVNLMISKIEILKKTKQWLSNDGQYIPYPTSWLNAKGWEDEIGKVVEKEPEWFGKKVEIQNSTSDEKKEIEDLLNDYK